MALYLSYQEGALPLNPLALQPRIISVALRIFKYFSQTQLDALPSWHLRQRQCHRHLSTPATTRSRAPHQSSSTTTKTRHISSFESIAESTTQLDTRGLLTWI